MIKNTFVNETQGRLKEDFLIYRTFKVVLYALSLSMKIPHLLH